MTFVDRLKEGKKQIIVTYGTCFSADNVRSNPWVIIFQKELDKLFPELVKILIKGQGAMNSNWGVNNLKERVLENNPNIVFLEFAANDAKEDKGGEMSGLPLQKSVQNLDNIIKTIKNNNSNCEVYIWTTMPITTKGRDKTINKYFEQYRIYCKENNYKLLDLYTIFYKLKKEDEKTYWLCVTEDEGHVTRYGTKKVIMPLLKDVFNYEI